MIDEKQKLFEKLNEMTAQICSIIIKSEINPWDSIGAILQSTMVVSAASGITLESILEHTNKILSDPIALEERNKMEAAYKKESSKNKTHLGLATK